MTEAQLAELKAVQEALCEGLRRTYSASGQEAPVMGKDETPKLRMIKGEGGAA